MTEELQAQVKAWAKKQDDDPPLATAIRRLVEMGLNRTKPVGRPSAKTAERAKQLAAKAIEGLIDPAAPAEEKATRKKASCRGTVAFSRGACRS
jgi:hypothetical protein